MSPGPRDLALRGGLGAVALGAATLAYAGLVERNAFVLRRRQVPVLPRGHRSLRVLHLTDLHLMPGQQRKVDWVRSLADLRPDLVVTTGDNIAHPDSVDRVLHAYEPFFGTPGAFVFGSNDYFEPRPKNPLRYFLSDARTTVPDPRRLPTERLAAGMAAAGWADLTNRRAVLEVLGEAVELVGVDDPHIDLDRYDLVAGPADPTALLTVGVTHAPYQRTLDAMTRDGARLLIAGHTHGGQVCLPLYGTIVTNCDIDRSRAKGVSRWWPGAGHAPSSAAPADAAWLEVSAGLGTSPYAPVRLACRPEATLLTLTAAR